MEKQIKKTADRLKYQRERRKMTGNSAIKRYEKTLNGFLMRVYRNMRSRIKGVQKEKFHLYQGKFLLEKEDFYQWAKNDESLKKLFEEWKQSGFQRKLSPSVDRKDPEKGYFLENMEWVTHSENSRRGALRAIGKLLDWRKKHKKNDQTHLH